MAFENDLAFLLSQSEPYVFRAYWSRGSWLVGYSSSTEGPEERAVEADTITTPTRALDNLAARLRPIRAIAIREAGPDRWRELSREQHMALGSLVWSYGYLPITIIPDVERTALAIEARAEDFNGRERGRRKLESRLYMGALKWDELLRSVPLSS